MMMMMMMIAIEAADWTELLLAQEAPSRFRRFLAANILFKASWQTIVDRNKCISIIYIWFLHPRRSNDNFMAGFEKIAIEM